MSASIDLFEAENSALPAPKYNEDLRADVHTVISNAAPKADVHKEEWAKVMAGASHARRADGAALMADCWSAPFLLGAPMAQASRWRLTPPPGPASR